MQRDRTYCRPACRWKAYRVRFNRAVNLWIDQETRRVDKGRGGRMRTLNGRRIVRIRSRAYGLGHEFPKIRMWIITDAFARASVDGKRYLTAEAAANAARLQEWHPVGAGPTPE